MKGEVEDSPFPSFLLFFSFLFLPFVVDVTRWVPRALKKGSKRPNGRPVAAPERPTGGGRGGGRLAPAVG